MTTPTTQLPPAWSPRPYRAGDEEQILEVLQAAFPRWPGVDTDVPAIAHLRWKLSSHTVAPKFHMIGEVDGMIASPRIVLVQPVRLQGESHLVFQPTDVSVAPRFRGLGITQRMLQLEWKLIETQRYMDVFGMKLYIRGWTAAHKVIRPRIGASGFAYGNRFIALTRPNVASAPANRSAACTLRQTDRFDERIDSFWEEASRPFIFAIDRNFQYLRWRFDSRGGRFSITLAEHDGHLLGYAVTSTSRGIGYIADLIALPGHLDVARDLASNALAAFTKTEATTIECWLPTRHPYRAVLQELGFVRSERKLRFRYTPVGLSKEQLEPLHRFDAPIHLTASDTDLV